MSSTKEKDRSPNLSLAPTSTDSAKPPRPSAARDRLLRIATDLFYREGIHTVGLERILAEASVTRATLYRHFAGKEALVAAYLQGEDSAIRGYFADGEARSDNPAVLVDLVILGIADDISRYHTRGCPFINASAEYPDPDSTVRRIVGEHRAWFRGTLRDLLDAAGIADPAAAAASLVLLRDAALVGGYLDGPEVVVTPFVDTARSIVASAHR